MKRLLNYAGSKWSMAQKIIDLMPAHKAYLEPYGGSLAIFMNKDKCVLETINDIDGRLVNMYEQIRLYPEELAKLCDFTLYSRKEFENALEISSNDLEDARRMLVRCWFSIGGMITRNSFKRNVSWKGPYNTFEWNDVPNRIIEASRRLKDAQIECKDALDLIQENNSKDVLIYADPPYLSKTRTSKQYINEYSVDQHIELLEVLNDHKGYVILSGYDSDIYQKYLEGWYMVKHEVSVGITNLKKKKAEEVIWCNFEPPGQISILEILENR
ncbi:DNA adenine methylase [Carnobacterium maltaromaticum]|uniref:DNA adenine methylase n=1 Tax=Lactobacillales TaxID=186826 RepID=UPI00298B1FF7|nr:DNA adenine methylase [Carnobacterium maltaromaticum]MDW5525194.1 DNA adenine methylase [Carnobacterium maltaromaticum]